MKLKSFHFDDIFIIFRCTPGVAVGDGKLFVVGGLGDNLIGPPGPLKTAEFYDPTSDSWTLLPDMYFARHSPSVAYKNRRYNLTIYFRIVISLEKPVKLHRLLAK